MRVLTKNEKLLYVYKAQVKLGEFQELVKLKQTYLTTQHKLELEVRSCQTQLVTRKTRSSSNVKSLHVKGFALSYECDSIIINIFQNFCKKKINLMSDLFEKTSLRV